MFYFLFPFCWKYPKTVDALAKQVKTPWQLSVFLWHRIWYKSDKDVHGLPDHWQKAEETLQRRTGDCEDFSILAKAVLDIWGYETKIIVVCNPKEAHAVCAFRYKDKWYHISNWGMVKGETPESVYKNWTLYQERNTNGRVLREHNAV